MKGHPDWVIISNIMWWCMLLKKLCGSVLSFFSWNFLCLHLSLFFVTTKLPVPFLILLLFWPAQSVLIFVITSYAIIFLMDLFQLLGYLWKICPQTFSWRPFLFQHSLTIVMFLVCSFLLLFLNHFIFYFILCLLFLSVLVMGVCWT